MAPKEGPSVFPIVLPTVLRDTLIRVGIKAFSFEKGPFFQGKGASRAPQIPHGPLPPGLPTGEGGGFTENPSRGSTKKEGGGEGVGEGGWCLSGICGAHEAPLP